MTTCLCVFYVTTAYFMKCQTEKWRRVTMWNEVIVAYSRVLSRYLPEKAEGNNEVPQSGYPASVSWPRIEPGGSGLHIRRAANSACSFMKFLWKRPYFARGFLKSSVLKQWTIYFSLSVLWIIVWLTKTMRLPKEPFFVSFLIKFTKVTKWFQFSVIPVCALTSFNWHMNWIILIYRN
jgi:hypothetical protein